MLKIILLLTSISALAEINFPVVIDNQSNHSLDLHYRNYHNMCSEYPPSIPANTLTTLNFCFPSSLWDAGLDAKEYLEFAFGDTRLIFNAYVDIKNNNSNYTTLRVVDARMSNADNTLTTVPFLDEKYTPIFVENASAQTKFSIQIKNKNEKPTQRTEPEPPASSDTKTAEE
jgi:hypothetical protein